LTDPRWLPISASTRPAVKIQRRSLVPVRFPAVAAAARAVRLALVDRLGLAALRGLVEAKTVDPAEETAAEVTWARQAAVPHRGQVEVPATAARREQVELLATAVRREQAGLPVAAACKGAAGFPAAVARPARVARVAALVETRLATEESLATADFAAQAVRLPVVATWEAAVARVRGAHMQAVA
jgi:hypothetical protein